MKSLVLHRNVTLATGMVVFVQMAFVSVAASMAVLVWVRGGVNCTTSSRRTGTGANNATGLGDQAKGDKQDNRPTKTHAHGTRI